MPLSYKLAKCNFNMFEPCLEIWALLPISCLAALCWPFVQTADSGGPELGELSFSRQLRVQKRLGWGEWDSKSVLHLSCKQWAQKMKRSVYVYASPPVCVFFILIVSVSSLVIPFWDSGDGWSLWCKSCEVLTIKPPRRRRFTAEAACWSVLCKLNKNVHFETLKWK